MNLLPYDSFAIETGEPSDIVARKLSDRLDTSWYSPLRRRCDKLAYRGTVTPEGFKIWRIINYSNSFMPIICGRFEMGTKGAIVHVTMRPARFIVGFMTVWFSGIGFGLAVALFLCFSGRLEWYGPLIPLGMLLGGLAMACGGFWFEASAQRKEITRLLSEPVEANVRA